MDLDPNGAAAVVDAVPVIVVVVVAPAVVEPKAKFGFAALNENPAPVVAVVVGFVEANWKVAAPVWRLLPESPNVNKFADAAVFVVVVVAG